jgi:hypothetical protein
VRAERAQCDSDESKHGGREDGKAGRVGHGRNEFVDKRVENKHIPPMRLRIAFTLPLSTALAVAAGAWEDDLAPRVEVGLHSRVIERGVDFAGAGAFGAVQLRSERWWAEAEHREPWRGAHARLSRLAVEYQHDLPDAFAVALRAAHRRHTGVRGWGWNHSTELGVALRGAAQQGFTPSVSWVRDLRLQADVTEARLAHSLALTRWGAFLDWSLVAGWVDAANLRPDSAGPRRADGYGYAAAEARLPYRIGESTMVVFEATGAGTRGASALWSARGRGDGVRLAFSLSVTRDF